MSRGQTTLDFAIGVSVFLIVVAFVLAFVPGMLDPFVTGSEEEPVVANRVADSLSQGRLGAPSDPYSLSVTCTTAFFAEGETGTGGSLPSECTRFENDVSHTERVGIEAHDGASYGLRIRIVADLNDDGTAQPLCKDGSTLTESPPVSCGGTSYSVGSSPPSDSNSVSVARRLVYLPDTQGMDASLLVEVW